MREKYLPSVRGEEKVRAFIIRHEGRPIGYVQTYRIRDHPDYEKFVATDEDAFGLDLFFGEEDFIRKGLGKEWIMRISREEFMR